MIDNLPDGGGSSGGGEGEDLARLAEKLLRKKAEGFEYSEATDEYAADGGGGLVLVKRKVSTKYVPPDLSALKALIGLHGAGNEYNSYTDEELESERERLLKELSSDADEEYSQST